MFAFLDVYLLEALLNGILLGGVFALLALGLNLVFGVIDVVWICYAELIMLGMYGMYFLYVTYHLPFVLAALISITGVGCLGMLLHIAVIQPLLGTAPINQLLATGGVLFFLQGCGDGDVRDRLPQSRHPPAGLGSSAACTSATRGSWLSGRRWPGWWRSFCSLPAATPAQRSERSRRIGRSCR